MKPPYVNPFPWTNPGSKGPGAGKVAWPGTGAFTWRRDKGQLIPLGN